MNSFGKAIGACGIASTCAGSGNKPGPAVSLRTLPVCLQ
jgi:hypothetical protein